MNRFMDRIPERGRLADLIIDILQPLGRMTIRITHRTCNAKSTRHALRISLIAAATAYWSFIAAPSAQADDCAWTGKTDGAWSKADNWEGGKVPVAGDSANFGASSNANITIELPVTVAGLSFTDAAPVYTISGQAITLASGGAIRKASTSTSHLQTIENDVHLLDRATFNCDDTKFDNFGNMLEINGHLQGAGVLTITGSNSTCGGVDLAADNRDTFTGSVVMQSGLLLLNSTGALGSGKTPVELHGGDMMCFGGVQTTNAFHIAGKVDWESSGDNSHEGPISIDSDATWTIGNGGGNPLTLSGPISGDGAIKMKCGNTTFSGSQPNTFTHPLIFNTDSDTEAYNDLRLAKSGGAIAIAAPIELHKRATLVWQENDQIRPDVTLLLDGGKLTLNGHSNKLGVLTVNDGAEIDLGSGGMLRFADSSGAAWGPKAQLLIHGWAPGNGAVVAFGSSNHGLTPAQVAKIAFDTPAGKTTGIYRAKISAKGELSPTDSATTPVNPPFDVSAAADKKRERFYSVNGLAELTGPGTPLKSGAKIAVFGDSITWLNGYISLIREALAKSPTTHDMDVTLINHGINGGGVLQIRDGSPTSSFNGSNNNGPQAAFAQVIATDQANIAVVYIGVNDVWWRNTSPEDFEKGMRDIVAAAQAANVKLVLATMSVIGEKPDGSNEKDKKVDAYCEITRQVAKSTGTTLVDLRKDYIAYLQNHNRQMHVDGSLSFKPNGFLTHEGVHPNENGAKMLANMIADGIYRAIGGAKTSSN
jgi:lysophospholipase L1-like esterase